MSRRRAFAPTVGGRGRIRRRFGYSLGLLGILVVFLLSTVAPAQAVFSGPQPGGAVPNAEVEVTMTGTGPGQGVTGGLPPVGQGFDPTAGYPEDVPLGYDPANEGFAGVITTVDGEGNTQQMYCIDIRVLTYEGLGYENGSWDESNVPNIGYVNRVLNSYYPDQPGLPEAANDNIRAAAVQAAVWFFSDGYVLEDTDPVRALTAQIVADVLAAGPLTEPPAPDVSIAPPVAAGPVDGVAGPFTITSAAVAEVTVGVTPGYTLYTDAAGTVPLVGTTVPAGTQLWVRNTAQTTDPAELTATAVVPVQTGNVYLYAGNNPQVTDAQKLILAADSQIESNAQATAEFFIPGDLVVNKTFAGEGAGLQGAITLNVACGAAGTFVIEIPAGTAAGVSQTISDLPVGTVCEVSEPVTGSNTQVTVTPVLPGPVTVTADGPNVLDVANTVDLNPGSLTVVKSLTGAAAGLQGDITVIVTCEDAGIEETLTIPAGSAAGDYAGTITDIPAGTACTVTEPQTGATDLVAVTTGLPEVVEIQPGADSQALVTNDVSYIYGSLVLTKTITGPGAGLQSDVRIVLTCGDSFTEEILIPAGTVAGDQIRAFDRVPAGSSCTVTEPVTGANSSVTVDAVLPETVTVLGGESVNAEVTNTYSVLGKDKLAETGANGLSSVWIASICILALGTFLVIVSVRRRTS